MGWQVSSNSGVVWKGGTLLLCDNSCGCAVENPRAARLVWDHCGGCAVEGRMWETLGYSATICPSLGCSKSHLRRHFWWVWKGYSGPTLVDVLWKGYSRRGGHTEVPSS